MAACDPHGLVNFSDTLTVYIDSELDVLDLPEAFRLENNYPNPFNPLTEIRYALPQAETVRISVYDLSGRHIAQLVEAKQKAGYYRVLFDASGLSSGVYLCVMDAGDFRHTQKMLLMK
ncbi:MAG: T9SS type A sorting domain-containing protein [Candidatus Marinimicrobia bacterium]|nr:T9SS type A sorting domain-containing protein [Candidatus Neomarinimicrobiota bacterium]